MRPEQKQVIVTEIKQWRRNRLLPDQYCDFLLNLYLDDESDDDTHQARHSLTKNYKILIYIGLFGLISFGVLYFNSFYLPMQIALSGVFIGVLLWMGWRRRKVQRLVSLMLLGLASVSLLLCSFDMMRLHHVEHNIEYQVLFVLCSMAWMVIGITSDQPVLDFCGLICLLFMISLVLVSKLPYHAYGYWQCAWLAAATVLFVFVYFKRGSEIRSLLYFVACGVSLFVPEAAVSLNRVFASHELITIFLVMKAGLFIWLMERYFKKRKVKL